MEEASRSVDRYLCRPLRERNRQLVPQDGPTRGRARGTRATWRTPVRSLESPGPSLLGCRPRIMSSMRRAYGKRQAGVQATGPFPIAQEWANTPSAHHPLHRRKPKRLQATIPSTVTLSNSETTWCSSSPMTTSIKFAPAGRPGTGRPTRSIAIPCCSLSAVALGSAGPFD